jgi:hypothetical protein
MPTTTIDSGKRGPEIVSGYDFAWTFEIRDRGAVRDLTGADIQAALVSMPRNVTLIQPVVCSSTAPGADWPEGLLTVEFPAAATAPLTSNDSSAVIEIAISQAGKRKEYHTLITIETGRITA